MDSAGIATTDANTFSVAILFSAMSQTSSVSIQLDNLTMSGSVSLVCDIDGDGVPNGLDLDSDNDGIFDIVESGNEALDTNNSGRVDLNDTGFVDADGDGADDRAELNTTKDTDSDGIIDSFELDSDNDGCNDVKEAGYTDANFDGLLGNVSITVTSSGTVSDGVDGYTTLFLIPLLLPPMIIEITPGMLPVPKVELTVFKSAIVSDVNNSSTTDLDDIITYTVTVQNTGLTTLTLQSYDTLRPRTELLLRLLPLILLQQLRYQR